MSPPPNVTTDLTPKKQEPSVELTSNKLMDQQVKHSNSWSSAVTEFRSTKHSHSWTIRGFSQAESKETVFKPVSSANDVSPTFRVRLLPVDQNVVRLSLVSVDLSAKYFARINLYNARNQKIITKSYNNILRTDHMEEIPRQTLLAQIGPEDELRIEVDLAITFDTTVTQMSTAKGDKTAERGADTKAEGGDSTDVYAKVGSTFADILKTFTKLNKAAAPQAGSKLLSQPVFNKYPLRTVVISLSCPGSDTQHSAVALVDTGAAMSAIKLSVARAYGGGSWIMSKAPISFVGGVGGGIAPVYGQVFLDVRMGDSVLQRQPFIVTDFKSVQDVILGTDFQDAVGPVTFHKDFLQVNGETVPYTSGAGGKSVLCKATPMNPNGDHKTDTHPKVGTTAAKPNKAMLNKAAASQNTSELSQSGVNQSLARTALISLSTSGSETRHPEVALVDSGAAGSLIKPSVAQALGWIETKVPIGFAVVAGAAGSLPAYGQMFLDVRIGNSVRRGQWFIVADFKTAQDVTLGTDFLNEVGSVRFLKDCMQINGETIPSGGEGDSVVCKSARTDQKIEASNEEDEAGASDKK